MTSNQTRTTSNLLGTPPSLASGDPNPELKTTDARTEIPKPEEPKTTSSSAATTNETPQQHQIPPHRLSTSNTDMHTLIAYGRAVADADMLANERQRIKETLRRTRDARRPLKFTDSVTLPGKAAASQSVGGAVA